MSRKRPNHNIWLINIVGDVLAVALAYFTALAARFYSANGQAFYGGLNEILGIAEPGDLGIHRLLFYEASAPRIIAIIAVAVCLLYGLLNLYAGRHFIRRRPMAWHIALANAVALGLFYSYFYARWNVFHPRTFFATVMALNVAYCVVLRLIIYRLLQYVRLKHGIDACPVILVGSSDDADQLDAFIDEEHPHGLTVVDRIKPPQNRLGPEALQDVTASVKKHEAKMVISGDSRVSIAEAMDLVALSDKLHVDIKILSREMDPLVTQAKISTDLVRGIALVHFSDASNGRFGKLLRRITSLAISAVLLAALLPLMVIVAVVVRITSHGPAVFVQDRVGKDRNPFRMFKFRTMHHMADEAQAEVEEFNESGEVIFKMKKDPRITSIGKLLRRFSMDELPQFVNVLLGQMTLIGPRPLPKRDYEKYYEEWQYYRHARLPGITGTWQVSGRSDLDFSSMCILDIYYLRNECWMLDLKILLKTVWVVLFAKGAY